MILYTMMRNQEGRRYYRHRQKHIHKNKGEMLIMIIVFIFATGHMVIAVT